MHTVVRTESHTADPVMSSPNGDSTPLAGVHVKTGDVLFQPGDERRHYRIEEGAIFHYIRWTDGSHDLIEVAFPGDIVGLGHLDRHVSTAQAMVDSVVSVVDDAQIERLLETDDRLPLLRASAGEREFDYVRDTTLNSGRRTPVERLANYLIAVAAPQDGDVSIVSEDIASGFVADRLQMSLDTLSSALMGLHHKGLLESAEGRLKITDVAELERVANAA